MYGKLSSPRLITGNTLMEVVTNIESNFYNVFMNKSARSNYNNKFIFFNINKEYKGEKLRFPERFLHICSIEDKNHYTIFPCNNDATYYQCNAKCDITRSHLEFRKLGRSQCLYRMTRIHWIPEIINLANKNDEGITVWTKPEKDRNRNDVFKHYIRYESQLVDYVVILKEDIRGGSVYKYEFISAFPVFTKRNKEQFEKDFNHYSPSFAQNKN
ncbi:hypothetical protein [Gracilibacillus lacisalsi]|uniref:hypothetical protein n=1 Tax=Gracilibacillus lacisalsi TaxID=393087 RepID=UPI00036A9687|nr:hypothetical protein [Gracilibacillus lacisalsi]